jgi:hypothetical protein
LNRLTVTLFNGVLCTGKLSRKALAAGAYLKKKTTGKGSAKQTGG